MKIREALTIALRNQDAETCGRVADQLRARGWTYARILKLAQEIKPTLTPGDWDDLMVEAEEAEAYS